MTTVEQRLANVWGVLDRLLPLVRDSIDAKDSIEIMLVLKNNRPYQHLGQQKAGRPQTLPPRAHAALSKMVLNTYPKDHGPTFVGKLAWTGRIMRIIVFTEFGTEITVRTAQRLLKKIKSGGLNVD